MSNIEYIKRRFDKYMAIIGILLTGFIVCIIAGLIKMIPKFKIPNYIKVIILIIFNIGLFFLARKLI